MLLALRDKQRSWVIADLEEFCDWLGLRLDKIIQNAPLTELLWPKTFQNIKIRPEVESAMKKRWTKLFEDLQIEVANDILHASGDNEDLDSYFAITALAAGGTFMTAAPLAAVPLVGAFAMATTTSFLVFTAPVISLPMVGGIAIGLAAMSFGGNQLRTKAVGMIRQRHTDKSKAQLRKQVIGEGAGPDAVSMLSQLLAIIDNFAQARIAKS